MAKRIDLQRIRKEKKLTQIQMAQLLGYPQSYISMVENQRSAASEEFLMAIRQKLKIKDIEPYYTEDNETQMLSKALDILERKLDDQQDNFNRLIDIIDKRDERIQALEKEISLLQAALLKSEKK